VDLKLNGRLLPDPIIKVILSGLLDSSWGNFHRSTIVRFTVYRNYLEIGIGEGSIHMWELNILRDNPVRHEWINIDAPRLAYVEGVKYVPETKVSGMPRGLLPVQSKDICVFISDERQMIFPAYRCFDINFGERRILSILSPSTLVRDIAEAVHPVFRREKYRGRVHNAEVNAEALSRYLKSGYGIGILRRVSIVREEIKAFPLLGGEDIKIILDNLA
jgi:hypothetical protein